MIYKEGKVSDTTFLFDVGLKGVKGVSGLYYIESDEKTCVIDSGTPKGAKRFLKKIKERGKSLPDYVLLTHAHWDHTQGVPMFRKKNSSIQVFASEKSIDLLADQSFNKAFDKVPMKNIFNVDPLKEGDIIDLGTTKLRVVEIPGHTYDHIGYYDEISKNMFAGDSIGIRVGDRAYIPPCMPPFWDEKAYYATLEKLKGMNIENLCLAHFGHVPRIEIHEFLDEMRKFYDISKSVISKVINNPDLEPKLTKMIMEELDLEIPKLETFGKKIPMILGVVNLFRKLRSKPPVHVGHIMTPTFVEHALHGYKMSLE